MICYNKQISCVPESRKLRCFVEKQQRILYLLCYFTQTAVDVLRIHDDVDCLLLYVILQAFFHDVQRAV